MKCARSSADLKKRFRFPSSCQAQYQPSSGNTLLRNSTVDVTAQPLDMCDPGGATDTSLEWQIPSFAHRHLERVQQRMHVGNVVRAAARVKPVGDPSAHGRVWPTEPAGKVGHRQVARCEAGTEASGEGHVGSLNTSSSAFDSSVSGSAPSSIPNDGFLDCGAAVVVSILSRPAPPAGAKPPLPVGAAGLVEPTGRPLPRLGASPAAPGAPKAGRGV